MTNAACFCLFLLAFAACSGVEADLLTLRRVTDLGRPDAGTSVVDFSTASMCKVEPLPIMGCEPLIVLKDRADKLCIAQGRRLNGFSIADACDASGAQGALKADVSCCTSLPRCTAREQGALSSCKDAGSWLQSAAWDCSSRGEHLEGPKPINPCSADQYQGVRYLCCTAP